MKILFLDWINFNIFSSLDLNRQIEVFLQHHDILKDTSMKGPENAK
jgi:hypothetical protein